QFTQTLTVVTLNAAGSSDSDDGIASYAWSFGDGSSASGPLVTHRYGRAGVYTVTLVVTDHGGLSASDTTRINVANRPPVAAAGADRAANPGQNVQFTDGGSYDLDGSIVAYAWAFGDGAIAGGPAVMHAYGAAGTYTVTLTVTDDSGARTSDSLVVTVGS